MKNQVLASSLLLSLAACNSFDPRTSNGREYSPSRNNGGEQALARPASAAQDEDKKEKAAPDIGQLEHDLAMAQAKLAIARLEAQSGAAKSQTDIEHARTELEMALAELNNFQESSRPHRVSQAELDLRSARDRAQEAKDELAQIEIMYDEQDLDDMTAEFVVSRGRRQAERAAARIALQEGQFTNLQEHQLPHEERKLQLALSRKEAALAAAQRGAQIGAEKQAMSLVEAERAVEKAETKLQEAREQASESTEAEG